MNIGELEERLVLNNNIYSREIIGEKVVFSDGKVYAPKLVKIVVTRGNGFDIYEYRYMEIKQNNGGLN